MNKLIKKMVNFIKKSDNQSLISFVFVIQGLFIFSFALGIGFLFAGQGVITVNAGADRNGQSGGSVRLLPTVADSEGDPLTYNWTCSAGSLSSSTALSPTLSLPTVSANTPVTCTLTATDDGGDSASDSVVITVTGGSSDSQNHNPIANAGESKTAFSGKTVSLLGDATDQDGDPLTYSWSCDSGRLSNSAILNPVFTAPTVASETNINCVLVVTDSKGGTGTDNVYVTVTTTTQDNRNPVVDAGSDRTIAIGASIRLTPTVSDPDGDPLTYNWTCTEGTLSSATTLNPTFTSYSSSSSSVATCTLGVSDGKNGYSSDSVYINIGNSASQNRNPIVDAGSDKYIQMGGSVRLTPVVSDPDGDTLTYNWTCTNGRLSSSNILSPTFTLNSGSNYNSSFCTLNVNDGRGGNASDSVNINTDQQPSGGNPVITIGNNREVNEGGTLYLNVTAYDPNGYSLTYNWTCNSGSLSSYTNLNPTYTAPMVNSDTNYYCTITASNNRGGTSSANVNILVKDLNSPIVSNAGVITSAATSVKTTTARLNGRVSNNSGSVNVSFDWGRINAGLSNNTNVSSGKGSGEYFSSDISDLEKGKAYQFKAKGQGSNGTVYGSTLKFITQPEAPEYFNASLSGSNRVNLTWTKGEGAYYTTITRKIGSYPQTATDGVVVYYGTGSTFTDSVSSGKTYYYRAWSVAYDGGLYAWSDSVYSRDYVTTNSIPVVQPTVIRTVTQPKVVVQEVVEEPVCEIIQDNALSIEITGKNVTQKKEWARNINANPGDEIDIQIKITSLLNEDIDNVILTNIIPIKVAEVSDVVIDNDSVGVNLSDGVILGKFKPKETRIMSFKIKIAGEKEFTERETTLVNGVEISGRNFESIKDNLMMTVTNSKIASSSAGLASVSSIFGGNWFWGLLIFGLALFILLLLLVLIYLIYLLMKRDKEQNQMLIKQQNEVERSKYFQIQ